MFFVDSFGSIQVAELDWGNDDHIRAVGPPFDYIIGTDVVSLRNVKHFFFALIKEKKGTELSPLQAVPRLRN